VYLAQSYLFGPNADLAEAKKYIDLANEASKADNPLPSLLKGAWLERSGQPDEAAKLYEFMMTQYAGSPAPYARRVELAAAAKKPGEAVGWAKKWLDKMPNDVGAVTEVVRRLCEAGEVDTAVKAADEWATKQLDKAKGDVAAARPPLPADQQEKQLAAVRAAVNLVTATGFFRAKAFAEAKKRVDAVLADDKESGAALMMAGDIAMAAKEADAAERIYRDRLKKAPEDFIAANNLAWVLCEEKKNPAEALKLLDTARRSGNDTPVAAERLPADFLDTYGRVYLRLNDKARYEEMAKLFEAAVKRHADDPRMHRFLGEAYTGMGVNSKALPALDRAIELAGNPAIKSVPEEQKAEAKQAAEAAKAKIGK
jgi:cellulose synthase operon protein C